MLTVRYRGRETGMYDGAPFVDEWKPLPPRLHDLRTLERVVVLDHPVAVATFEEDVTGLDLAEARAYAAARGARLPTEDEWQLAAAQPGFGRRRPLVWNWTESEHSDGRSRFCMLKGGADGGAVGSPWYFDTGEAAAGIQREVPDPGRRIGPLDVHRISPRLGSADDPTLVRWTICGSSTPPPCSPARWRRCTSATWAPR